MRQVITENPTDLPALVALSPELCCDDVARFLLKYYDDFYHSILPETASMIVQTALIACRSSVDADLRCRAWKEQANVHRYRARYEEADEALNRAAEVAPTDDPEFYAAVIDHSRAALLYDMRRTDAAAECLRRAIERYVAVGATRRAEAAQTFYAYIEHRRGKYEASLAEAQAKLARVRRFGREEDIPPLAGFAASCLMWMKEYEGAHEAITEALAVCQRYGMVVAEVDIRKVAAFIRICRDGVEPGLRELESVRTTCRALGMAGLAVRALLDAVEIICELVDPSAEVIVPMCHTVQVEASRLHLSVDVAEATERLRVAAMQHRVTVEMIDAVRNMIDPAATVAAEGIAN